jgi:predicted ABC-type ATPase
VSVPGRRPLIVCVAGPNGAGKTTFYEAHLRAAGLYFVSADRLAREFSLEAYEAAEVADTVRRLLRESRESFVFETVFSDPVGGKLDFLKEAERTGYSVVLCVIGISDPGISEQRVAMRVSQGGHDVPTEKLIARFPRTMNNIRRAIRDLHAVWIFDNDDLRNPFRKIAVFEDGKAVFLADRIPGWFLALSIDQGT